MPDYSDSLLIPLDEAARLAGFATKTLRHWISRGQCPFPTHRVGGRRMVRRADLAAWIDSLGEPPQPPAAPAPEAPRPGRPRLGGRMTAPITPGLARLLDRLGGLREAPQSDQVRRRWKAYCPAHQPPPHPRGRGRTLAVAQAYSGGVLIHCHAGCSASDVLSALALPPAVLFPPPHPGHPGGPGNGGPAAWTGAMAAADTLREAAAEVARARAGDLTADEIERLARVDALCESFLASCRRAARQEVGR